MSSIIPTYIPSPNWEIPANSDVVILGRMVKDPKNPESRVPMSGVVSIPSSAIFKGEKTDWETNLEKVRSGKIGLWAKCLQFISAGMSFSNLKSSLETHKFSVLETSYFLPDEDYFAQAVKDPGVQKYFKDHRWSKPVYLITGVKIARKASASTDNQVARSVQAEVKVDATSIGANIEAGPEASWELKKQRGISYGNSTDYIFAYRLISIMPKDKGESYEDNEHVEGALYGKDEDDDSADLEDHNIFEIKEEVSGGFQDTWEQVKDYQL